MTDRSYDQFCGLALALDAIGDRWGLLVVRELLSGPRRFSDLMVGLPGVATNTLTTRLEQLEKHGVLSHEVLPPPAASAVYRLTEKGRGLEPAIIAMVKWAVPAVVAAGQSKRKLAPLRSSWLALALKAFFDPSKATRGQVALMLPTGALTIDMKGKTVEIRDRSPADLPAATFTATEDLVIGLITKQVTWPQALKLPGVELQGDEKALKRSLGAFQPG